MSNDFVTLDATALNVIGGGIKAPALRVTVANDSTGLLSVDDGGGSLTVDDGPGSLTVDDRVPLEESYQRAILGETFNNIGIEFLSLAESFLRENPDMGVQDAWDKFAPGIFEKAIQDLEKRRDKLQLELEQWDEE